MVDTASGEPAGRVERLQFARANFITLGSHDLSAGTGAWQFAPIGATATGVVLVNVATSYFVPVASALAERRQRGAYISSLGETPEDLVRRGWTNGSSDALDQHLVAVTPLVHSWAERHLTYPVLQYFHSGRRERTSTARTSVVLDEAMALLRSGVADQARPAPVTIDPLARAVGWYLDTVQGELVADVARPLAAADLEVLRGRVSQRWTTTNTGPPSSGRHRGGVSWLRCSSTKGGSRKRGSGGGNGSGRTTECERSQGSRSGAASR